MHALLLLAACTFPLPLARPDLSLPAARFIAASTGGVAASCPGAADRWIFPGPLRSGVDGEDLVVIVPATRFTDGEAGFILAEPTSDLVPEAVARIDAAGRCTVEAPVRRTVTGTIVYPDGRPGVGRAPAPNGCLLSATPADEDGRLTLEILDHLACRLAIGASHAVPAQDGFRLVLDAAPALPPSPAELRAPYDEACRTWTPPDELADELERWCREP